MKSYDQFKAILIATMETRLGNTAEISIDNVVKTNHTEEQISLLFPNLTVSPGVNLKTLYSEYQELGDINSVADRLQQYFVKSTEGFHIPEVTPEEPKESSRKRRKKGTGCVTQRKSDGKWIVRINEGYAPNGKVRIRSATCTTKEEAEAKALELTGREYEGTDIRYLPLNEYMIHWLRTVKRYQLKPKSLDRLEQTMHKDIFPALGGYRIGFLKSDQIQTMIADMVDDGRSFSSVKKVFDALNACYKLGMLRGELDRNPCTGVSLPKSTLLKKKDVPVFTEEELRAIAAAAMNILPYNGEYEYRLGAIYIVIANTGLRLGEVCALKWDRDVFLEKRYIQVHCTIVKITDRSTGASQSYKVVEQDSAKTAAGTNRRIRLNNSAYNAFLHLKKITGTYEYVLSTKEGSRCDPRDIDKTFRRILVRAGIPKYKHYGVHSLRHSFATLMIKNGVDIKTVSKLMGHSDVSTTYKTYIHVLEEMEFDALEGLPEIF